jgi:hypothetical protein
LTQVDQLEIFGSSPSRTSAQVKESSISASWSGRNDVATKDHSLMTSRPREYQLLWQKLDIPDYEY